MGCSVHGIGGTTSPCPACTGDVYKLYSLSYNQFQFKGGSASLMRKDAYRPPSPTIADPSVVVVHWRPVIRVMDHRHSATLTQVRTYTNGVDVRTVSYESSEHKRVVLS